MRILIVGAGIGGPTLAYWLLRSGHQPTLIESAPRLREGGYLVDFWGAGFDVAQRMGIVPELMEKGYRPRELREVKADGRVVVALDPRQMIDDAAGGVAGRYVTVARTDLASAIYDAAQGQVETIFGQTVNLIRDDGTRVQVEFTGGETREFDLVIGADGLHSRVRRTVFGPDADYQRDLGLVVAAFDVDGYEPRDEMVAVSDTEVGFQSLRFARRDGATMLIFTVRYDGEVPEEDPAAQQELLRGLLAGAGGEVPAMLARMPEARTFYFDRASQIRMPSWSHGRVALIGDAAACPSLLAGQGSALAMVEAYELAAELRRSGGDHLAAFVGYHQRLAPLVLAKQNAAIGLGAAFAPRNRAQLLLRDTAMRMMTVRSISRLIMRRSLRDPIQISPVPTG
ncbi:FAD-binding domain [Lysinimonas soli]|uniref:FAD-binding domain n=1 Tax=Lysinimonas soli TaxID=1074233 RepID=A0ABW0NSJ8_9MICO